MRKLISFIILAWLALLVPQLGQGNLIAMLMLAVVIVSVAFYVFSDSQSQ